MKTLDFAAMLCSKNGSGIKDLSRLDPEESLSIREWTKRCLSARIFWTSHVLKGFGESRKGQATEAPQRNLCLFSAKFLP